MKTMFIVAAVLFAVGACRRDDTDRRRDEFRKPVETTGPATPPSAAPAAPPATPPSPAPAQPAPTDPWDSQPSTPQPGATQPSTAEPGATQPSTTQPGATQPSTTQPGATQPGTTEPEALQPSTTEPGALQPSTTEPGALQPSTQEESAASFIGIRRDYASRSRSRLGELDSKIADLELSADANSREVAVKLRERRDQLAQKLDTVGAQGAAGWEDFKADVGQAFEDLERDLDAVKR